MRRRCSKRCKCVCTCSLFSPKQPPMADVTPMPLLPQRLLINTQPISFTLTSLTHPRPLSQSQTVWVSVRLDCVSQIAGDLFSGDPLKLEGIFWRHCLDKSVDDTREAFFWTCQLLPFCKLCLLRPKPIWQLYRGYWGGERARCQVLLTNVSLRWGHTSNKQAGCKWKTYSLLAKKTFPSHPPPSPDSWGIETGVNWRRASSPCCCINDPYLLITTVADAHRLIDVSIWICSVNILHPISVLKTPIWRSRRLNRNFAAQERQRQVPAPLSPVLPPFLPRRLPFSFQNVPSHLLFRLFFHSCLHLGRPWPLFCPLLFSFLPGNEN